MNNKSSDLNWTEYFLDKYNVEKTKKEIKKAAKVEDIITLFQATEELRKVNTINSDDIRNLRLIIGNIMRNVNNISRIYKMGIRGNDVSQEAKFLLEDVNNFKDLKTAAKGMIETLKNINIEDSFDKDDLKISIMHIQNMLKSLLTINFYPEQIKAFNQMAYGNYETQMSYAEEVNAKRMESFLKGSIYSSKDKSDQTIKVIREILQNAVDATLKIKDENHKPEIRLYVSFYGRIWESDSFIDLSVIDNGVGMDLEKLSKNFYVYFQSGKENEEMSAGGFGIAKAVIQETPQDGWSIETNDIGSNSFHKNMYMGTKLQEKYEHPKLDVNIRGTKLNLYHIPFVDESSIKNICSKYATSNVDIYYNDTLVQPIFDFNEVRQIDNYGEGIIKTIASNDVEQEIAEKIINDKKDVFINNNLGGNDWNFKDENGEDKFIKVAFFISKIKKGDFGAFFVRINGQYQYEKGYVPQCDVVCEVSTNTRPNDNNYPMDPGRENLRSPIKEFVEKAYQSLKDLIRDITSNEIFKEGLDIFIYNKDKDPITTYPKDEWDKLRRKNSFLERLQKTGLASNDLFYSEELSGEELSESLKNISESNDMTDRQKSILNNMAIALQNEKQKVDTTNFVNDIIDILETPCEVTIQKNFVSNSIAHEDIDLTTTLIILWQEVLKIIIDGSRGFIGSKNIEFIPGLVYSDKAIALYSSKNPKIGRNYDTISINPMYVASIVKPELFDDYLLGETTEEMGKERQSITRDETPINRLSVFLFHEAIHEITHLIFPDFYADNYESFHLWISKIENVNHFNFTKVRDKVKLYMPQLKKDSDKLIRRIKKDKK